MKHTHLFAFALAAALTAVPSFAQEPEKAPEAPKAQAPAPAEKEKAVKPESGSTKAQEANQEKTKDARKDSKLPQSDQEPAIKNPEAKDNKADNKGSRMPQSEGQEASGKEGGSKQVTEKDRSVHYSFKSGAREKLHAYYSKNASTTTTHNVTIVREQVLPVEVRTVIQPVPVEIVSDLGPAPDGFMYGYADGYVFVYDPDSFFVIDVIAVF